MRLSLLAILLIVGCANADEISRVEEDKAWLLRGVSVLMEKNDPREFPAIVRAVSLPTSFEECVPNIETEEICPQKDLYLVFSNWDIAADVHAFEVGRAYSWRVGELTLVDKESQSFWKANLRLELDKFEDNRKVTKVTTVHITNSADQYTLEISSEKE